MSHGYTLRPDLDAAERKRTGRKDKARRDKWRKAQAVRKKWPETAFIEEEERLAAEVAAFLQRKEQARRAA
ncbi:hypothetical protein PAA8504_02894 [Palleronia abyssalis]|uniref:Uncharacterized protein n=1 Tax=Palleronia abyssalis TaxID=1501240 RepID=A0A2R8BY27_9RHOB|nr:hypothetical protein PAA8504_02894 [Palleronia abyssalis]